MAYVVVMYPRVSHTFVQNEVWALRRHGVDVTTFSVRRADSANILSRRDESDAQSTVSILPLSGRTFIQRHILPIARHPVAFFKTAKQAMANAPKGIRAKLWSCFYLMEALAVWSEARAKGIRHLHAHFANVASDVALLAAAFGNRTEDSKRRRSNTWGSGEGSREWTWSFTMHGPAEFNDVERFNLRYKANSADAIACISEFCKNKMSALANAESASRMQVVHCGIDLDRFPFIERTHGTEPLRVLCVGRLVAVKAQNVLIDAVAKLVHEGVDIELILVGDGPMRGELEAQVQALAIMHNVTFTGNVGQDGIRDIYRNVDIFALPSYSEGLPVVLMEAMASGLPVVTTAIAGIPEMVRHGESGLIVQPGDIESLSSAIRTLALDPSLRLAYGANGRKVIEQSFDVDQTSKQLLGLVTNIIDCVLVP